MSFVVFSMLVRLTALTFLWIYLDSKIVLLFVCLLTLHFFIAFRLEYGHKGSDNGGGFSIWLTSFVNIFLPCWYYRRLCNEDKLMERLAVLTIAGNLIVSVLVGLCYFMVNWTDFKYNNNILNNGDFIIVSISLLIFLFIQISVSIFYIRQDWTMLLGKRNMMTIITCTSSVICGLVLIFQTILYNKSQHGAITLVSQHYQDSLQPKIFLKSYRGQHLGKVADLSGELTTCADCSDFNDTEKILIFDPTDNKCGDLSERSFSGRATQKYK